MFIFENAFVSDMNICLVKRHHTQQVFIARWVFLFLGSSVIAITLLSEKQSQTQIYLIMHEIASSLKKAHRNDVAAELQIQRRDVNFSMLKKQP